MGSWEQRVIEAFEQYQLRDDIESVEDKAARSIGEQLRAAGIAIIRSE